MDKKLMEAGVKVRREVLGDEYVDRSMKNADEFNRPFQEIVSDTATGRSTIRAAPFNECAARMHASS